MTRKHSFNFQNVYSLYENYNLRMSHTSFSSTQMSDVEQIPYTVKVKVKNSQSADRINIRVVVKNFTCGKSSLGPKEWLELSKSRISDSMVIFHTSITLGRSRFKHIFILGIPWSHTKMFYSEIHTLQASKVFYYLCFTVFASLSPLLMSIESNFHFNGANANTHLQFACCDNIPSASSHHDHHVVSHSRQQETCWSVDSSICMCEKQRKWLSGAVQWTDLNSVGEKLSPIRDVSCTRFAQHTRCAQLHRCTACPTCYT